MKQQLKQLARQYEPKITALWQKHKNAIIVGVLMLFAFFLLQPSSHAPHMILPVGTTSVKAFSLLVTLKFQDAAAKQEFLADIMPVADYIRDKEPTTLGYEVMFSDQDELQVLILERYLDKENAYLRIHKSGAEFLSFRPKLKAMEEAGRVQVSGHSYMDSGVGFVGRS